MSRRRPWLPLLLPLLLLLPAMLPDTAVCLPAAAANASDHFTETPQVNRLTCYFCENVENNHICNRFAIDHPCPAGTSFCRTLHIMDTSGQSLVVNKHCASDSECGPTKVGCLREDHQKTCVSCCHSSYCNELAPTNYSNAVREVKPTAPTRAVKSEGAAAAAGRSPVLLVLLLVTLVTTRLRASRPGAGD